MGEWAHEAGIIAVTGATGALGGRVAARLAKQGLRQRLIIRDLNRAPEFSDCEAAMASYEDGPAFGRAARGARTLLLVSATESPHRVAGHLSAVDAAVAAGVEHIVYLSFLNARDDATFTYARDHYHTERYIRATGVRWTFLRPALYLDMVPHFVGADGAIRGPGANGRVAWVSRDDIADCAAAILIEAPTGRHDGRIYDLTGPEAMTLGETVSRLSMLTGRTVAYVPETWEEALESRRAMGVAEWQAVGWASSYAAIAAGELDTVSDAVDALAGHPPQSLEGFLRRHPSTLAQVGV